MRGNHHDSNYGMPVHHYLEMCQAQQRVGLAPSRTATFNQRLSRISARY
jgi:hypothetical protein